VGFEPNRHVSGVVAPEYERLFGRLAITYSVRPRGASACRLVVKLDGAASTFKQRVRRVLLAWGDLIMMRKQPLTLKALAERDARAPAAARLSG
jgi:hypothetical protein